MLQIWENKVHSDAELRTKMAQRLSDFRIKLKHFEYLVAQMEVMIDDYIDLKDGRKRLE